MALTITRVSNRAESLGSKRFEVINIAFDSSYPTGGEALTAATLGFRTIDLILVEPSAGYSFEYDHTNEKLIARRGDNANAAAAPAVEVANAVDLSGVTGARAFVVGTV